MWYVYILECKDESLYTGSTTDVLRRLEEHNSGKGANYTRVRLPVRLVHKEEHPDRSNAQKREAQIKGLPRKQKLELIAKKER
jgi:putative endonuclease